MDLRDSWRRPPLSLPQWKPRLIANLRKGHFSSPIPTPAATRREWESERRSGQRPVLANKRRFHRRKVDGGGRIPCLSPGITQVHLAELANVRPAIHSQVSVTAIVHIPGEMRYDCTCSGDPSGVRNMQPKKTTQLTYQGTDSRKISRLLAPALIVLSRVERGTRSGRVHAQTGCSR